MRLLAVAASCDCCLGLRRMPTSIVWRMLALSTLAQFGLEGTNQLNFAASANGASVGFDA